MATALLAAAVLAGVVALTPVAGRLRLPLPVVLTLFGLVLGLLPWTGPLEINPEHVLPVVLPPLLFAATLRATVQQFRRDAGPIALLAGGLTLATAGAVAVVAHALGLGWGEAVVAGAIVSPPDPVAATSVARQLALPPRLITLLEGEGLFNDATALVLYGVAVSALVTGEVTAGGVAWRLLLAVVVGTAVGLAAGWATRRALALLHSDAAETALTVSVPFGVYLLADHFEGSGVLAVLALGLYLRARGHAAITSGGWLLGRAVWRFLDYLVTSVVFVLLGLELTAVLGRATLDTAVVLLTAAVLATIVGLRMLWVQPAVRLVRGGSAGDRSRPLGPREGVVAGWAGMRGVVTVAAALSLPREAAGGDELPGRSIVVLLSLSVVLITLVVQGLTLPIVVRRLGVGVTRDERAEADRLRRRAAEAGLRAVHAAGREDGVPEVVHRAAAQRYESELSAQQAIEEALVPPRDDSSGAGPDEGYARALGHLARAASEAEREVVLEARASGEVSVEVADEVLTRVEARALRDLA